jgi:23S rRNA (uracil1939-C5)-methyltransferase
MQVPCPIWRADCGCSVMPRNRGEQAADKRSRVVEALRPVWPDAEAHVAPTRSVAPDLFYRSKASWVFAEAADASGPRLGAWARGSHNLLPLRECVVVEHPLAVMVGRLEDELRAAKVRPYDEKSHIGDLRYVVGRSTSDGKALLTFIGPGAQPNTALVQIAQVLAQAFPHLLGMSWQSNDSKGNAVFSHAASVPMVGVAEGQECVSGLTLNMRVETFFQVHRTAAEALRARMEEHILSQAKHQLGTTKVWDLYCGVGVNALCLARRGLQVHGVESHAGAITAAKRNAEVNLVDGGASTCTFTVGSLDEITSLPTGSVDVVVLNPPRKGANAALLNEIAMRSPHTVVYIACEPRPLALAIQILSASGYSVHSAEPFDLFPQTEHVETLLVMTK